MKYTAGVAQAASGASDLKNGANELQNGTGTLYKVFAPFMTEY